MLINSINDGIPSEHTTVQYANIDKAISFVRKVGPACFMAKTDIRHAFRLIPIQPNYYPLLGTKWNNEYYYDRCMPMGCASSCKTFERFSTAVEWIVKKRLLIEYILHLLDDFFLVASTQELCQKQLGLFYHCVALWVYPWYQTKHAVHLLPCLLLALN